MFSNSSWSAAPEPHEDDPWAHEVRGNLLLHEFKVSLDLNEEEEEEEEFT